MIWGNCDKSSEECLFSLHETLRYGEPVIQLNETNGALMWSVPIMINNLVLGGIGVNNARLVGDVEENRNQKLSNIKNASTTLLQILTDKNLVNEHALKEARHSSRIEQNKADAIHLLKNEFYNSVQEVYTKEEPSLLNAIRRGDREEATNILNRIFVVIYHNGSSSQDLLKSYLLELIAMMSRAAVEAGSQAEEALGLNFKFITELSQLKDDEDISGWLAQILDKLFSSIQKNQDHPHTLALNKAYEFMAQNLSVHLKRDVVAKHIGISSSHFANLMATYSRKSFRELLTEFRVNHAAKLLSQGKMSLAEIALECGFSDQSHFSRVFSKATKLSPGDYRKLHSERY